MKRGRRRQTQSRSLNAPPERRSPLSREEQEWLLDMIADVLVAMEAVAVAATRVPRSDVAAQVELSNAMEELNFIRRSLIARYYGMTLDEMETE